MTVANGREFLSIPGPTNSPDAVLQAMHRPAIYIYSGDMVELTRTLLEDLPKLFRTSGRTFIYAANGHGGWEAAVSNVLSRGETVLVLESGVFAIGWGDMARMLGIKVEVLKGSWRRAVDPAAVAQRLAADTAHEIKAILVVQVDTASAVVNEFKRFVGHRRADHPALLMVDGVASLGCMPFEMDAWKVDVAMSGSQKGLMTPPGLAFVAANDRALAAHQKADLRTRYWDWTFRMGEVHYQKYGGTPPQHLLFALRKALDMLLAEGLDRAAHARAPRRSHGRAVGRWAGAGLAFNITRRRSAANLTPSEPWRDRSPARLLPPALGWCGRGHRRVSARLPHRPHMGPHQPPMLSGVLGKNSRWGIAEPASPHGSAGLEGGIAYPRGRSK